MVWRRAMTCVLLTHTPDMLQNYYGERALAKLKRQAEARINPCGRVLDADALAHAARGCEIIVSDRQTAGPAALFRRAPDELVAFLRCAVDIRNIDVAAASALGILVTPATPRFAASVAEMAVGFLGDISPNTSSSAPSYTHAPRPPPPPSR